MTRKRAREESVTSHPARANSKAAKFNLHVLKMLEAAVKDDPEVDLMSKLPLAYSDRLIETRSSAPSLSSEKLFLNPPNLPVLTSRTGGSAIPSKDSFVHDEDIRSFLRPSDPAMILFPSSEIVSGLLADDRKTTNLPNPSDPALSRRLLRVLQRSDILWKSTFPHNKMVFKCGPDLVIKAIRKLEDYTEYTTLQYLEKHVPSVPAPKPLGLIRMSGISLIFMTYTADTCLEEVWTKLDVTQKASSQNQLNEILADLRSLPCSDETPLGGRGRRRL